MTTPLVNATEATERIAWSLQEHGRFPTRDELLALRRLRREGVARLRAKARVDARRVRREGRA